EDAPVGESQCNCFVENRIREAKGLLRTYASALNSHLDRDVKLTDAVLTWLIEYVGMIISRYAVGGDGRTPYERIKRKKCSMPICEFGERVLFMPSAPKSKRDVRSLDPRYKYGVWLGIAGRSSEARIGTPDRLYRSTSVRRVPKEERWSSDALYAIEYTPWTCRSHVPDLDDDDAYIPDRRESPTSQDSPPAPRRSARVASQASLPVDVARREDVPPADQCEKKDEVAQEDLPPPEDLHDPQWANDLAEALQPTSSGILDTTGTKDVPAKLDLSDQAQCEKIRKALQSDQPALLITSSSCASSKLWRQAHRALAQEGGRSSRLTSECALAQGRCEKHILECEKLWQTQHSASRHFLHEHSILGGWSERLLFQILSMQSHIHVVEFPKAYGQSKFLTNSLEVVWALRKLRDTLNDISADVIDRTSLRKAICTAARSGFAKQGERDRVTRVVLEHQLQQMLVPGEDFDGADVLPLEGGQYIDDVKGGTLPAAAVRKARREEMQYVHKHKVYVKCPVDECWSKTGRPPIRVRWVDTNKGTASEPNYRSRLVAMQFNTHAQPELFASTPPLEGMRMVIAKAAELEQDIMTIDVRRAYFYARVRRELYVDIPEEDREVGDEKRCDRLLMSLYGTRDAAQNWQDEISSLLLSL
ncbi:reverse transcriptase domain-containing protein, partial [bacterium]|nr:reverse transcriptase domain-containing protein [bacterium]